VDPLDDTVGLFDGRMSLSEAKLVSGGVKMAKVVQVLKVVRNNWKKSVFIFAAASFSVQYAVDKYK
jgi:hypothetical protein